MEHTHEDEARHAEITGLKTEPILRKLAKAAVNLGPAFSVALDEAKKPDILRVVCGHNEHLQPELIEMLSEIGKTATETVVENEMRVTAAELSKYVDALQGHYKQDDVYVDQVVHNYLTEVNLAGQDQVVQKWLEKDRKAAQEVARLRQHYPLLNEEAGARGDLNFIALLLGYYLGF